MAYVSQDLKNKLSPQIKAVLNKYGMKGSIAVGRGHTSLRVRIKAGKLPLIENFAVGLESFERSREVIKSRYIDVNPYHFEDQFSGKCKQFLIELHAAMNQGNHDRSDIMTDYFDVGWYTDIHIGEWNKPYEMVK